MIIRNLKRRMTRRQQPLFPLPTAPATRNGPARCGACGRQFASVWIACRSKSPFFPEFLVPNLPDCVAALICAGASSIVVMPIFIAQGAHLKREVPEMLGQLRSTYREVQFSLGGAIGENDIVIQATATAMAMARAALAAAGEILIKSSPLIPIENRWFAPVGGNVTGLPSGR